MHCYVCWNELLTTVILLRLGMLPASLRCRAALPCQHTMCLCQGLMLPALHSSCLLGLAWRCKLVHRVSGKAVC